MPGTTPTRRPRRKAPGRYHHGDLRQALLDQALRVIDRVGVESLTLRGVGDALGVSRTALYRHFADKQALMAAVAREGFRSLRLALTGAWEEQGRGREGFEAMGEAYLRFAVAHPAHYRVMFGRFVESAACEPEMVQEARGAFQALVDALIALQASGDARRDDPELMARFVWAVSHGIAMLAIDGQLGEDGAAAATLNGYAIAQIHAAITP